MNSLASEPVDPWTAEALVLKAAECLDRDDWHGAVSCLESAATVASSAALEPILGTLDNIYISRNQNDKLARRIAEADPLTPQLIIGAFLLIRNRQLGLGAGPPPRYALSDLLTRLRKYIANGQYSGVELTTICSLLAQLEQTDMAVSLLLALLDTNVVVDEELICGVLALAAANNKRRDAVVIVDRLCLFPGLWLSRAARYRVLLGGTALSLVAPGEDKVIDFVRRNAGRLGAIGSRRGRRGEN